MNSARSTHRTSDRSRHPYPGGRDRAQSSRGSHAQRSRTKRSTPLTLTEALVVGICLAALCVAFAQALREPVPKQVSTTSVRVQTAQTLWDLATQHPVDGLSTAQTVSYIQDLNDRTDATLAAGEVLLVPDSEHAETALAAR